MKKLYETEESLTAHLWAIRSIYLRFPHFFSAHSRKGCTLTFEEDIMHRHMDLVQLGRRNKHPRSPSQKM